MSAAGLGTVLAVVLAAVFVWAAAAKVVRHRETIEAFAGLGVAAPAVLSIGVPVAELAAAAALIARPVIGGAVALALLVAFTAVVVRALVRGIDTGCGCFGARHPAPIGPADVVRNGVLAAFALVATGAHRLVAPSVGDVAAGLAAVVVGGTVLGVAQRRLVAPPRRARA